MPTKRKPKSKSKSKTRRRTTQSTRRRVAKVKEYKTTSAMSGYETIVPATEVPRGEIHEMPKSSDWTGRVLESLVKDIQRQKRKSWWARLWNWILRC